MRLRLPLLLLFLPLAALLVGCGGGGNSDRDEIIRSYDVMADAIEHKDIDTLMSFVSLDYLQGGADRNTFEATYRDYFATHSNIRASFVVHSIDFETADHEQIAFVNLDFYLSGYTTDSTGRRVLDEETDKGIEGVWIKEHGTWRLFGDQTTSSAQSTVTGKRSAGSLIGVQKEAGWQSSFHRHR
jgi:hypothetical protein